MCLCGVTERSGHVDRTLQSVHPELQCLKCDRTRSVNSDRTLRIQRPVKYSKHPVREKWDRTHLVSGDRTLPASGQH